MICKCVCNRNALALRELEGVRSRVAQNLPIKPLITPETGALTIANRDICGSREESQPSHLCRRGWRSKTKGLSLSVQSNHFQQSQGTSKSFETEYAKATPSFGTTHSFPIHKSHATRSVRFGAPQKIPSQLIYLFDGSVIQLEKGDEVYGDCREYRVYQLKAEHQ